LEHREIEIKLALAGPRARLVARLRNLGARLVLPRHLEDNFLFDDASRRISRAHSLLRVRLTRIGASLTFKGPSRVIQGMKSRAELETGFSDGETLLKILDRLGMRCGFRYQKYRTLYRLGSVHIALDETPIGNYIEVEGTPSGIARLSKRLGFQRRDFITGTYHDLFVTYKRANRIRVRHMLFDIV
jgi:adenylate cyclase, class 2